MSESPDQPAASAGQAQSQFPYTQFYRTVDLLADLQVSKNEQTWMKRAPRVVEEKDYLLFLGCNVLRTPALIQTVTDVLTRMGIDFAAVGGPENCCGIIHYGNGDLPVSTTISDSTLGKLRSFKAKQVLMWCPSCTHHFQNVLEGSLEIGFPYIHATQFISENLHRLKFEREMPLRVGLHTHTGTAQADLDAECTKKILSAIPGLELVEMTNRDELGISCVSMRMPDLHERLEHVLEEAKAKEVDVLTNVYHTCQRELCGAEARRPFKVENYIQLLGRALGIEHDDLYKRYTLDGNEERIFRHAQATTAANGITDDQARSLIRNVFVK